MKRFVIRITTRMEDYGHGLWWSRGRLLGSGGFARVYTATNTSGFRFSYRLRPDNMAVKSAKDSVSESLQFEKEVFDYLRGCPDHIIQCFGHEWTTAEDGEQVYNLLLEYASGGTLSNAIQKSGGHGLCEADVRSYARSIVCGLKHMHGLGYVHCDIKPDNVLLVGGENDEDGFTAKIADLGLAKRSEMESCYGNNNKNKRKRSQQQPCEWRGTLEFLAPETLTKGVQESPSDIWALGCVVLEMLTGKPVWGENLTEEEIACKIRTKNELPVIPSELSKEAKKFLKLCLARNPKRRFQAQTLLYHPFLRGGINNQMRQYLNEVDLSVFTSGVAANGVLMEVIDPPGSDYVVSKYENTIRPKRMRLC